MSRQRRQSHAIHGINTNLNNVVHPPLFIRSNHLLPSLRVRENGQRSSRLRGVLHCPPLLEIATRQASHRNLPPYHLCREYLSVILRTLHPVSLDLRSRSGSSRIWQHIQDLRHCCTAGPAQPPRSYNAVDELSNRPWRRRLRQGRLLSAS
jgi:hypothetical protein